MSLYFYWIVNSKQNVYASSSCATLIALLLSLIADIFSSHDLRICAGNPGANILVIVCCYCKVVSFRFLLILLERIGFIYTVKGRFASGFIL